MRAHFVVRGITRPRRSMEHPPPTDLAAESGIREYARKEKPDTSARRIRRAGLLDWLCGPFTMVGSTPPLRYRKGQHDKRREQAVAKGPTRKEG